MSVMASQITDISTVCLTVYSGEYQRKHWLFVKRIYRWPVDSPHKGPVTQKAFPWNDVIRVNRPVRDYHYSDVIMGSLATPITSLTLVYSTVYSRRRSEKASKLRVTGLCAGNSTETGEFPSQMASIAENVSIWWRHHEDAAYFDKITTTRARDGIIDYRRLNCFFNN